MSAERLPPPTRADYRLFRPITTRWMDNDVYGHVNNVHYYSYFDTAVNSALIDAGLLDIEKSPIIGLVVETQCRYFSAISFPDRIDAGICVDHLGTSSVRYGVGIFRDGEDTASAAGHFIHVHVTRDDHRPAPIPDDWRGVLEGWR